MRSIRARPVQVPFKRPPISASGALPHAALVLIDLETEEGLTGRSYLFGFASWTLRPILGCVDAMGDMLKGDAVAPFEIEAKLRKRLTLLDTPGLVGLALAGVDMCAWDVLAQATSLPLVKLLGGELKPIRAYNSCGLWIQPVERLADEAEALMAEGGFSAIKLRLGRDDPSEDLAAVRAVKKRVGDKITVMCDYNQRLTVNEAILRGRMLDDEGLYWIEEPVRHDDYAGCARVAAELRTPLQTGENLVDTFELINALEARAMDYVMPDVQRIGGVTGWLRAAAITQAYGMEMSSHLFPEYSAHLLAVTPTGHWLEYMDWATPIVAEPIQVKDGHIVIPDRPGSGITWNEDAVKRYAIA
ncbi:MAG TPA: enolase C-terminal domain-like protein [Methylomirabilota bacterium]|nr:enolase C-terminal domain-like protein [Methylomirabilota bacterium]